MYLIGEIILKRKDQNKNNRGLILKKFSKIVTLLSQIDLLIIFILPL